MVISMIKAKFEKKLISLIRPGNRLSIINCICGFYENLPSADNLDIQDAVTSIRIFSTKQTRKTAYASMSMLI